MVYNCILRKPKKIEWKNLADSETIGKVAGTELHIEQNSL